MAGSAVCTYQQGARQKMNVRPHLNTLCPFLANVMPPCLTSSIERICNLQQPLYLTTGSTQTAGSSAPIPPPARQMPSHNVVDPQLPQKMWESLRSCLTTECSLRPVSDGLVGRLHLRGSSWFLLRECLGLWSQNLFLRWTVLEFNVQLPVDEVPTSFGAN